MSDLLKAMELLSESKESDPFRFGTVQSISGGSATVRIGSADVPAIAFCQCSAGDRVLMAYSRKKYLIIGKKEE